MYKLYSDNTNIIDKTKNLVMNEMDNKLDIQSYIDYINCAKTNEQENLQNNQMSKIFNIGGFFTTFGLNTVLPLCTLVSDVRGNLLVAPVLAIGLALVSRKFLKNIRKYNNSTLESKLALKTYDKSLSEADIASMLLSKKDSCNDPDKRLMLEESCFVNKDSINKLKRKREIIAQYVQNKIEFINCYKKGTFISVLSNKYGYNFTDITFVNDLIIMEKDLCYEADEVYKTKKYSMS